MASPDGRARCGTDLEWAGVWLSNLRLNKGAPRVGMIMPTRDTALAFTDDPGRFHNPIYPVS